jgi:hypothetical protein
MILLLLNTSLLSANQAASAAAAGAPVQQQQTLATSIALQIYATLHLLHVPVNSTTHQTAHHQLLTQAAVCISPTHKPFTKLLYLANPLWACNRLHIRMSTLCAIIPVDLRQAIHTYENHLNPKP